MFIFFSTTKTKTIKMLKTVKIMGAMQVPRPLTCLTIQVTIVCQTKTPIRKMGLLAVKRRKMPN